MLFPKNSPEFINEFIDSLDEQLRKQPGQKGLSSKQNFWLRFCCMGILLCNSVNWKAYERRSLGRYGNRALSWMFRHSRLDWDQLLINSVRVILKKYDIEKGTLTIDDWDHPRSKNAKKLYQLHKIKDKKTSGYINGQCVVFLVLVTEVATFPVGFEFYEPNPAMKEWQIKEQQLKEQKVAKKDRPPAPPKDPNYPTKSEIAVKLVKDFHENFPQIHIQCVLADALYGNKHFCKAMSRTLKGTQVISQIRSNQKVFFRNKTRSLQDMLRINPPQQKKIQIRSGKTIEVFYSAFRVVLKAHQQKCFVVALRYPGEEEYRYLIALDLSWRGIDIVEAYTFRWLVEVFLQDWTMHEGWAQLAKHTGEEGSRRGLTLSLMLDLCLLLHPHQLACRKHKQPLVSLGSLVEHIRFESLIQWLEEAIHDNTPEDMVEQLKLQVNEFVRLRPSDKHMNHRTLPDFKPSPSLRYKNREGYQMAA